MRKALLLGALAVGLLAPLAYAQTIVQNQISTNEVFVSQQGPGGASGYVDINTISSRTHAITATIAGNLTLPTSFAKGGNYIVTAQPAAATITFPASPIIRGAIIGICNPTAAAWATNVVTVAGNTGQTSPAGATATLTTLAAGTCARYQWVQSTTSWYKVQ